MRQPTKVASADCLAVTLAGLVEAAQRSIMQERMEDGGLPQNLTKSAPLVPFCTMLMQLPLKKKDRKLKVFQFGALKMNSFF